MEIRSIQNGNMKLEFSEEREFDTSWGIRIGVVVRLFNKSTGEIREQTVDKDKILKRRESTVIRWLEKDPDSLTPQRIFG